MSVPADVALGRHHSHHNHQHASNDDISPPIPDNIPFQFYSSSLPGIVTVDLYHYNYISEYRPHKNVQTIM